MLKLLVKYLKLWLLKISEIFLPPLLLCSLSLGRVREELIWQLMAVEEGQVSFFRLWSLVDCPCFSEQPHICAYEQHSSYSVN